MSKKATRIICIVLGILMLAGVVLPVVFSRAETLGAVPNTGVDLADPWVAIVFGVALAAAIALVVIGVVKRKKK